MPPVGLASGSAVHDVNDPDAGVAPGHCQAARVGAEVQGKHPAGQPRDGAHQVVRRRVLKHLGFVGSTPTGGNEPPISAVGGCVQQARLSYVGSGGVPGDVGH
eukprot:CAMPEP_0113935434 /NCGR_PEP_ID=MMETSP1339-20121228/2582_1 /TAXON_ID=94617 /ORGANISM="Fibrocapsa japonica" /LENGTH=102 /DNA_ID=CAMNT_0000937581 /DNA_START=224 /DNA_END=533 /DNA_ORIENTATION=+ /assembly_acc=CAM_ASM_000762